MMRRGLILLGCSAALNLAAQTPDASTSTPQLRPRLDPVSRTTAVLSPPAPRAAGAPADSVLMERYIVRGTNLVNRLRRPGTPDPKGPFTLQNGGKFFSRDAGPFRFEVGLWTHIDIAPDGPASTRHQGFDFIRIKW